MTPPDQEIPEAREAARDITAPPSGIELGEPAFEEYAVSLISTACREYAAKENRELMQICYQTQEHEIKNLHARAETLQRQANKLAEELLQSEARIESLVAEANRRDRKWMDGIDETIGAKLNYHDPHCDPKLCASMALSNWAQEIRSKNADQV